MRHSAYFNTSSVAQAFFKMVCAKKIYNGKRITSIGCGGHTKYRPYGPWSCFTFVVSWDTE